MPVGVHDAGLEVSGDVLEADAFLAGGAGHRALLVVLRAPHVIHHVGGEWVDLLQREVKMRNGARILPIDKPLHQRDVAFSGKYQGLFTPLKILCWVVSSRTKLS